MRQRSSWKQYAAAVGAAAIEGRKASEYPQTAAALDLWARSNAIRGMKWMSPEVRYAEWGERIGRAREGIDEIEDRTNAAIKELVTELREVIRVHHEHKAKVGERTIGIPHEMSVPARAKRYFGLNKDRYYELLAAAYFHIAGKLGYDGR